MPGEYGIGPQAQPLAYWEHVHAAAFYAQLERRDEALDAVAAFEEAVERDHWLEGYRKAVLDV